MENIILVSTVSLLHLFALLSPGPDFIMIIRNTLSYSHKIGVFTGFWIAIGNFCHIILSFFGIAVIISQSIVLFNFIKIIGALYLIFIGLTLLISKNNNINIDSNKKNKKYISSFQSFQMWLWSAILNPKVTLFYLSIFSLVIPSDTSIIFQITLGLILTINTFLYNLIISYFFSRKHIQNIFLKFQKYFNKIFGSILIALGIKVAITQK